jgi:hypothetical protein
MSDQTYIKRAIAKVKLMSDEINQRQKTKVTTPIADQYCAALDVTTEFDSDRIMYFQGLIRVLQWIFELGRLDIVVAM